MMKSTKRSDVTSRDDVLIPDRYPDLDLFTCDIMNPQLRDLMSQMEHPFYSLTKKPDLHVREYHHGDNWIRIIPSVKGLATIYDKDILIYGISQIIAAMNDGRKASRRIRINSYDFLRFTNRGTGGKDYSAFVESLERLGGTRITTNIRMSDGDQTDTFGLIDASTVKREFGLDGRIQWVEMQLSDWVFNAIEDFDVLSLHKDYFRLRRPLERRIYEIARKHCGTQKEWRIGIDKLLNKTGARSAKKLFKFKLNDISKTDHLPDYSFKIEGDNVIFTNKGTMLPDKKPPFSDALPLDAYEAGRKAAPGWDIYQLEQEWRNWVAEGTMDVKNPKAHFTKFCASWFEKRGKP
jgi:plasmid replication initiation protein